MTTTSKLAHLHSSARALALLADEPRIRMLQRDRWIDYPRATEALRRLERLLETPQRERMNDCQMRRSSGGRHLLRRFILASGSPRTSANDRKGKR